MKRFSQTALVLLFSTLLTLGLSACGDGSSTTTDGADSVNVDSVLAGGDNGGMQQGISGSGVTVASTISMLQQGVRNVATNQAVQNINGWQQQLDQQGSSGPAFSQISSDLGQLKTELTASQLDGQAIGDLLSSLGEQTTQVAENASGQRAQQIQELGSLLSEAGSGL